MAKIKVAKAKITSTKVKWKKEQSTSSPTAGSMCLVMHRPEAVRVIKFLPSACSDSIRVSFTAKDLPDLSQAIASWNFVDKGVSAPGVGIMGSSIERFFGQSPELTSFASVIVFSNKKANFF